MGVFGEDDYPPFMYTIGNYEYGLPELLIIGSTQNARALNVICERMHKQGCPFTDGELIDLGGTYPLMALDAGGAAREQYTVQVGEYYQTDDYSVQQIVIPDPLGRYPFDPDCAAPFCLIPILWHQPSALQ